MVRQAHHDQRAPTIWFVSELMMKSHEEVTSAPAVLKIKKAAAKIYFTKHLQM